MPQGQIPWGVKCGSPLRKKPGQFCGQWALRGATRCRIHGGSTPRSLAKAEKRLDRLAELCLGDAIAYVRSRLENPRVTDVKKLEIAMAILTRMEHAS